MIKIVVEGGGLAWNLEAQSDRHWFRGDDYGCDGLGLQKVARGSKIMENENI